MLKFNGPQGQQVLATGGLDSRLPGQLSAAFNLLAAQAGIWSPLANLHSGLLCEKRKAPLAWVRPALLWESGAAH